MINNLDTCCQESSSALSQYLSIGLNVGVVPEIGNSSPGICQSWRSLFSKISSLKFTVVNSIHLSDRQISLLISTLHSTCHYSPRRCRGMYRPIRVQTSFGWKTSIVVVRTMAPKTSTANERAAGSNDSWDTQRRIAVFWITTLHFSAYTCHVASPAD